MNFIDSDRLDYSGMPDGDTWSNHPGFLGGTWFKDFFAPKKAEEGETGNEYYQKHIHEELRKWNKKAHKVFNMYLGTELNPETTVKKKRKTVQENINNKVQLLLAEVDFAIDVWDVESFDMYKYLADNKASAAVAKKIPEEYQDLRRKNTKTMYGYDANLKVVAEQLDNNFKALSIPGLAYADFTNDALGTVDGFIAHEVSDVVPDAVLGTKDAVDSDGNIIPQGVDLGKLVPLLVKTVQELEARITELEG